MEREGVDLVFAYPGGASMEIHQALTRSKTIRNILCRHEQVSRDPRKHKPGKLRTHTRPHLLQLRKVSEVGPSWLFAIGFNLRFV